MLALAGANARDFAILQVFLQTGVRVGELCALSVADVDLDACTLIVRAGKGMRAREIELERRGTQALRAWLRVRPPGPSDALFTTRDGWPLGARGVRDLVARYRCGAGITRHATPHSLRHTFATHKAEQGVSPFQLQRWLGHANLNTTQLYVHLSWRTARRVMEATSLRSCDGPIDSQLPDDQTAPPRRVGSLTGGVGGGRNATDPPRPDPRAAALQPCAASATTRIAFRGYRRCVARMRGARPALAKRRRSPARTLTNHALPL